MGPERETGSKGSKLGEEWLCRCRFPVGVLMVLMVGVRPGLGRANFGSGPGNELVDADNEEEELEMGRDVVIIDSLLRRSLSLSDDWSCPPSTFAP